MTTVALAGDGAGGDSPRIAAGVPRGRTTYADRVFTRIAAEAASGVIGVPRGDLSVEVSRYRDGLSLRVRSPLPVPSLDDDAAIRAGGSVLDRVAGIQTSLRDRVATLTGRDVVRVDVRVTGAVTAPTRRVR